MDPNALTVVSETRVSELNPYGLSGLIGALNAGPVKAVPVVKGLSDDEERVYPPGALTGSRYAWEVRYREVGSPEVRKGDGSEGTVNYHYERYFEVRVFYTVNG